MSTEYPDILGDLVEARQRFEVNGLHFVPKLDLDYIAPGEATALHIYLQNCWDLPVQVSVHVNLATEASTTLSVIQKRTDVPLQAAEAGVVTIPIASSTEMEPGDYAVPVTVGLSYENRGRYIRSQENEGQLGTTMLSFTSGMALSETLGLGFKARTQPEHSLHLTVEGPPAAGLPPDLTPTYVSHWTVDDFPLLGKARQYVNDQKLFLLPKLERRTFYMAFLEESQARFKAASLPLHIGEAIYAAKILTHTAEYLLKQTHLQDALLVPPYVLAYRHNLPTGDPILLIARADYARMVRLACSLTFGLLNRRLGREVWTQEEQVAVTDLIAGRMEQGGMLPAEFLYLPLLLGGLMVSGQVQMPGENPAQSLALLSKARQQRSADLGENPELVQILDGLIQSAK